MWVCLWAGVVQHCGKHFRLKKPRRQAWRGFCSATWEDEDTSRLMGYWVHFVIKGLNLEHFFFFFFLLAVPVGGRRREAGSGLKREKKKKKKVHHVMCNVHGHVGRLAPGILISNLGNITATSSRPLRVVLHAKQARETFVVPDNA